MTRHSRRFYTPAPTPVRARAIVLTLAAVLLLGGCSTIKGWWPWGGNDDNQGALNNRRPPMSNAGGMAPPPQMAGEPQQYNMPPQQHNAMPSGSSESFFSNWFNSGPSQESVAYQARKRPVENQGEGSETSFAMAAPVLPTTSAPTPAPQGEFPELGAVPEMPDKVAAYQANRNELKRSMQEMDDTRASAESRRANLMNEAMETAEAPKEMMEADAPLPPSLPEPMKTMASPTGNVPPPPVINEVAMSAEVEPVMVRSMEPKVMEPIRLKPPAALKTTRFLPESRYAAVRRMSSTTLPAESDPFTY